MQSTAKFKRSKSTQEPSLSSRLMTVLPDDLIRCLRETRLVDDDAIEKVAQVMCIRRVPEGEYIIKEGTIGRAVFILLQGQVIVSSDVCESEIGVLGPGNVIGEIGGLLDVPRTMNIISKSPGCTVGAIMREEIIKIPGLVKSLIHLAKKRLEADEEREKRLLKISQSRREHFEAMLRTSFGEQVDHKLGHFVKRANQVIMLLTSCPAQIFVLEGTVRLKHATSGEVLNSFPAGEKFIISPSEEYHVLQAINKTVIYYYFLDADENQDRTISAVHEESVDTFAAAIEQATRLSQVISTNNYRRSSIAVWSDESFLRPIKNDSITQIGTKRRQTMQALPYEQNPSDVIELMVQMGVPAELHRQKILRVLPDGLLQVNMDHVHQYVDEDLIEAVLLMFGSKISCLSLNDCWNISDNSLLQISRSCPNLRSLKLSNNWHLTEDGILKAFSNLPPGLVEVEIKSCAGLTDECLSFLCKRNIVALDVSYCKNLGSQAWSAIVETSETLTKLSMRRCSQISGELIISTLAKHPVVFKSLEHLDLSDCSFLSDNAICSIVRVAPNLRHLNISFCQDLDVSFFSKLAEANASGSIKELLFEHCQAFVTDESCNELARNWKGLRRLSARGCSLLTNQAVKTVASMENLKEVDFSSCPRVDPNVLTKTALTRSWKLEHPPTIYG